MTYKCNTPLDLSGVVSHNCPPEKFQKYTASTTTGKRCTLGIHHDGWHELRQRNIDSKYYIAWPRKEYHWDEVQQARKFLHRCIRDRDETISKLKGQIKYLKTFLQKDEVTQFEEEYQKFKPVPLTCRIDKVVYYTSNNEVLNFITSNYKKQTIRFINKNTGYSFNLPLKKKK